MLTRDKDVLSLWPYGSCRSTFLHTDLCNAVLLGRYLGYINYTNGIQQVLNTTIVTVGF